MRRFGRDILQSIKGSPSGMDINFDNCPFFGPDSKVQSVPVIDVQNHASTGCVKCRLLKEIAGTIALQNPLLNVNHMRDYGWRRVSYKQDPKSLSHDVEVFVANGTPKLFPELQYRFLSGDVPSVESLACAKEWIHQCSENHKSCQRPSGRPLPKRLLDVSGSSVRLVEPAADQRGQYIALSHCWGNFKPECITTRSTIAENMNGLRWTSLPKTFLDAIQITGKLGIQYLWIDSLCILQDDLTDWAKESSKMASVYQNSYLTICATSAQDDDAGLWPRAEPTHNAKRIVIPHMGKEYEVYVRNKENIDHVDAVHMVWWHSKTVWNLVKEICPLMARGWTFQERLLAPRLLHYGYGELLWQCADLAACECCPPATRSSKYMGATRHLTSLFRQLTDTKNKGYRDAARTWKILVRFYSELQLTLSKDSLPAVSGLAKTYLSVRPGDTYLAGLWKDTLIDDLCWNVCFNLPKLPRPETWRAPTWSWVSAGQSVDYTSIFNDNNKIYARIIRASTVLATSDPTGEVLSGSVVLVAPVTTATVTRTWGWSSFEIEANTLRASCHGDSETDFKSGLVTVGTTVYCLRMRTIYGNMQDWTLLLVPTGDDRPGVFKRIGMATIYKNQTDEHWYKDGSHETEVEII